MLDSYSVQDLETLYGINRSTVYARIKGLEKKGYQFPRESVQGRSVFNADQKQLLDALDQHIQTGMAIATFPAPDGATLPVLSDSRQLSHQPASPDSRQLSHQTGQPDALLILAEAIAARSEPVRPLSNLEELQRAYECGWWLSSSKLALLLERKEMPTLKKGEESFIYFGLLFCKAGKNGRETAWRISKP
jgi:biotin operon repressor